MKTYKVHLYCGDVISVPEVDSVDVSFSGPDNDPKVYVQLLNSDDVELFWASFDEIKFIVNDDATVTLSLKQQQ